MSYAESGCEQVGSGWVISRVLRREPDLKGHTCEVAPSRHLTYLDPSMKVSSGTLVAWTAALRVCGGTKNTSMFKQLQTTAIM